MNFLKTNRKLFLAAFFLIAFFGFAPIFDKSSGLGSGDGNEFDILASAASQFGPAVTKGQTLTTADMTADSPKIPSDIYRPGGTVGPDHEDLATFAWLEFISLVSPKGSVRGETGGSFEKSGKDQNATLVWESYHHRSELFPFVPGQNGKARAPQPWDAAPSYKMSKKDGQLVDIPYSNYNNLDETTQIGQNILYFPKDPQSLNPDEDFEVLFEAKVNQNDWKYTNDNYKKFPDFNKNFPNGIDLPSGSIEVKATWRPQSSIPKAEWYRFHMAEAIYYTGEEDDPKATLGTFALIGLHIIHKTPNYPAFIFATFEHTDNLVKPDGSPSGLYYVPTYDSIAYTLPGSTETANPTETISDPNYPHDWIDDPYAEPTAGNKIELPEGSVLNNPGSRIVKVKEENVVVVPVSQPPTTNSSVANVNKTALSVMKGIPGFDKNFVWQYYFLKGVQGVPSDNEKDKDYYLANIVTESSVPGIQLFTGGIGQKSKTLNNPRSQVQVRDIKQMNPTVTELPSSTISGHIPSGLKVSCFSGPNSPSGWSTSCPVIQWNGLTYWALSYIDNRYSLAIAAYDTRGNALNYFELKGTRYVYKIEADDASKTITFYGQSNTKASIPYSKLIFPLVSELPSSQVAKNVPSGLKISCYDGPGDRSAYTSTCPVVEYNGLSFWPFSYNDNRNAIGLTAYDGTGKPQNTIMLKGTRYIYKISVDVNSETVTFYGQSNSTATAKFSQLASTTPGPRIVFNVGGCQGCHGVAQTAGQDFSFLYFSRTVGFGPEVHGIQEAEATKLRSEKYMKMLSSAVQ